MIYFHNVRLYNNQPPRNIRQNDPPLRRRRAGRSLKLNSLYLYTESPKVLGKSEKRVLKTPQQSLQPKNELMGSIHVLKKKDSKCRS